MAIIRQAENSKNRKRKENQPAQHYKATQSQSNQLVSVVVIVRLCSKRPTLAGQALQSTSRGGGGSVAKRTEQRQIVCERPFAL